MRRPSQAPLNSSRAAVLCAAVLASGLARPAAASSYNPENLAPGDHATVAGLCRNVVGLSSNTAQYDACLDALSAATRDVARERVLASSQAYCVARNLPPGSPALARCELDASRSGAAGPPILASLPPALSKPPARSYWYASNAEIHRREETACAELGLEPVGGRFAQCVASLDASLFSADNSAH